MLLTVFHATRGTATTLAGECARCRVDDVGLVVRVLLVRYLANVVRLELREFVELTRLLSLGLGGRLVFQMESGRAANELARSTYSRLRHTCLRR